MAICVAQPLPWCPRVPVTLVTGESPMSDKAGPEIRVYGLGMQPPLGADCHVSCHWMTKDARTACVLSYLERSYTGYRIFPGIFTLIAMRVPL